MTQTQPDPPAAIGPYHPVELLGGGAHGVVYRAVGADGAMVAVKAFHLPVAHGLYAGNRRIRAFREVDAMQRVRHPRVAEIVDFNLSAFAAYIVTRYVDGVTLDQRLDDGPLRDDELRLLARGLAEALAAIHAEGLVHRDIKPANVVVTPDGPTAIDFSISCELDATPITGGGAAGTRVYMAPELRHGKHLSAATDVFSWAVTVAEAATGRHPFRGEHEVTTEYRILNSEPVLDGVPGWLDGPLRAALSKDPAARPSAAALVQALADPPPTLGRDVAVEVTVSLLDGHRAAGHRRRPGIALSLLLALDVLIAAPIATLPRLAWLTWAPYAAFFAVVAFLGTWAGLAPAPPVRKTLSALATSAACVLITALIAWAVIGVVWLDPNR